MAPGAAPAALATGLDEQSNTFGVRMARIFAPDERGKGVVDAIVFALVDPFKPPQQWRRGMAGYQTDPWTY